MTDTKVFLADLVPDPMQAHVHLRDKGTNNRDAGGVAGDGLVDPVIVVGEPEIAQATGDAACVRAREEGGI
jgi:hypothetical protein